MIQINIQRGLKTIMYKTKRDQRFERMNFYLIRQKKQKTKTKNKNKNKNKHKNQKTTQNGGQPVSVMAGKQHKNT